MKITIKDMTQIALMAAILCVIAPLSIPLPTGVPLTLAVFIIYLTGIILGSKKAVIAIGIYIVLGALGLPVFSGYSGGLAKLVGPTGGYIIGYLFSGFFTGLFAEKSKNLGIIFVGMLVGMVFCLGLGTGWLAVVNGMTLKAALLAGVVPFILWDMLKLIAALVIGLSVKKILVKGKFL